MRHRGHDELRWRLRIRNLPEEQELQPDIRLGHLKELLVVLVFHELSRKAARCSLLRDPFDFPAMPLACFVSDHLLLIFVFRLVRFGHRKD
jgi:hypothetical protein